MAEIDYGSNVLGSLPVARRDGDAASEVRTIIVADSTVARESCAGVPRIITGSPLQ